MFGLRGLYRRAVTWIVVDQPSWVTSLLVHLMILMVLALLILPASNDPRPLELSFSDARRDEIEIKTLQLEPDDPEEAPPEVPPLQVTPAEDELPLAMPEVTLPELPSIAELTRDVASILAADPAVGEASFGMPGGFEGREGRRGMALDSGASAESEEAVDRALVWLAAHQGRGGRWTFDLRDCGCNGKCRQAGTLNMATNGSTALALLPFLGAGQTHESGYHRHVVEAGLNYLLEQQRRDGSFHEPQGNMYSHGIATLVLCESLAMTKTDPGGESRPYRQQPRLRKAAQRAIDFIEESQHAAGGWRYSPNQRGDTSVVGWQAMALQSAKMAKLKVSGRVLERTSSFLDSVQTGQYGSNYGYLSPGVRPGTSAIGLLTRMYLGWDRTHPGIAAGASYLNEIGPSANNVYYDYYATQVMHHYQGPLWRDWNRQMRDHLVETQETKGHESGSWYFDGDYGSQAGGRLYITAMSTMILEVYYRHQPIYRQEAVSSMNSLKSAD